MIPKTLLRFLLIKIVFISSFLHHHCHCQCNVKSITKNENGIRGMFVFGSSLVDNGNNNFLINSLAKVDFLPYGIDFPAGPSGRFTNGKNVIDLLTQNFQLPSLIPPFYDPSTKGSNITHGVNFASGSSGILDETGLSAVNMTSLNQQIKNFEVDILPQLEEETGCKGKDFVGDYLFVVGSGGNDYTLNFFLGQSNKSLEAFTTNLTLSLSLQLKKLHSLGATKFVLMSIYPLGCYPVVKMTQPEQPGCVDGANRAAQLFNTQLKNLTSAIKSELPQTNLVFVDAYKIIEDIIQNPNSKGFKDANSSCCEVLSKKEGGSGSLCKKGGKVCADRNSYVFFDGIHPTEAVNIELANKAFASNLATEVYPINIKQLAKLKV